MDEWLQANGIDPGTVDPDIPVVLIDEIIQWMDLDGYTLTTWCHVRPDESLEIVEI